MDALNSSSPVHFYDTLAHRILCGVRGVEHHSTKHVRSVTCQACVSLLVKQRGADARSGSEVTVESIAH